MDLERRKPSNYLVNRRAQFRLLIPLISLMCLGVVAITILNFQFTDLVAAVNSVAEPNLQSHLEELAQRFTLISSIFVGLMGLSCLVFWVIYSHRIFGPMVPIRRQLDSLLKGDYQTKIALRKYDEFTDVADQINQLTAKMKEQKGEP